MKTWIIATSILAVLMIASGIWLTRKGRPYNVIIYNIHKIISLGAILVSVLTLIRMLKGTQPDYALWILIFVSGLSAIVSIVTGGILNIEKLSARWIRIVHRVMPFLIAGSLTLLILLLKQRL